MRITKFGLTGISCLALLVASGAASATDPVVHVTEQQIQRLTDLVVETMPLGEVQDHSMAADPTWPLKQRASRISAEQLACIRSQLSSSAYRVARAKDVRDFANAHADEVADAIKVLEGGAAKVSHGFVMGGVRARETGTPLDPAKDMKSITGSEMIAYTKYEYDPKFADLRNLTGIGDANDPAKSSEERHQAMAAKFLVMDMDAMYRAMDACHVPPATML